MTVFADQVQALFPWVPSALVGVFATNWANNGGDLTLTQAAVRADPSYSTYFAGNKRPDGTVYLPEDQYLATIEGYNRALQAVGVDPNQVADKVPTLIAQNVSPAEFASRIAQVLQAAPTVRDAFAADSGSSDFSDAGIVASWLDGPGGASPIEFDQRFAVAGIQGGAATDGFHLSSGQAEHFVQNGVSTQQADQVFQRAGTELPQLNDLLARHDDPHDPFDIYDYGNAVLLQTPADVQAISRALAGGRADFSAQHLDAQDQAGGVSAGLTQR